MLDFVFEIIRRFDLFRCTLKSAHMSALSLAVSEGHLYTVSILLDRGADVNRRTKVLNLVKTTNHI